MIDVAKMLQIQCLCLMVDVVLSVFSGMVDKLNRSKQKVCAMWSMQPEHCSVWRSC